MFRSSRLLACLFAVIVLSCLHATPATATRQATKTAIFVDTDIGIDDAVAVGWLLNNRKVNLVGFTTVFGNASVENTTRNLLTLLDVANREELTVTIGAAAPLELPRYRAGVAIHGLDGFWFNQQPKDISTLPTDASAALIGAVQANPQLTILALGPLTNIARAVTLNPTAFADVRIVAVGGGTSGNTTPVAEFNAFLDPHALDVVLASPAQLELVTIDAFDQPTVDPEAFVAHLATEGGAVGQLLATILPPHFQAIAGDGIAGEATLPDAAAAVYAVQPGVGTGNSALVRVLTDGYGRGQTIIADTFSERVSLIGDPEEISVLAESAFIPGFDLNGAIFPAFTASARQRYCGQRSSGAHGHPPDRARTLPLNAARRGVVTPPLKTSCIASASLLPSIQTVRPSPMSYIVDILLTALRHTIADLGKQGGRQSVSIYDTAQVIRFSTDNEAPWPALEWLLTQQEADGGWGNPAVPRARDVPTLTAVLALHRHALRRSTREAIQAGVNFLRRQTQVWSGPLPEDLPAGIELIIPHLLEDPASQELGVFVPAYASLLALGKKRRAMIARIRLEPGTTPVHSWEAFGTIPTDPDRRSRQHGHSPSATAAWLRSASQNPQLHDVRTSVHSYLRSASAATGSDIPGLMPSNWPIDRFEQSFGLHALLLGDLLDHPGLQDVLQPQIAGLAAAMLPSGLGFSDYFVADGDDTAAAVAVLHACGHNVPISVLTRFQVDNYFVAWHQELQHSLSVTARAAHALTRQGFNVDESLHHLCKFQLPDGRWMTDKWHGS
ncbi:hypothetical protein HC891_02990, partial [Candidatus Gracilibacteria bacterium]|nr:hypothetical protein [Candidatus Gracilibacteria bacterium]